MTHRALTPEEKAQYREHIFYTRPTAVCTDCGGFHLRTCPRVKRIAFIGQGSGTGNRTEVEYWEKWDDSETIYPEDVWDDEPDREYAPRPVHAGGNGSADDLPDSSVHGIDPGGDAGEQGV